MSLYEHKKADSKVYLNGSLSTLTNKYTQLGQYNYSHLDKSMQIYEEKKSFYDQTSKNIDDLKAELAAIALINTKRKELNNSFKYSDKSKPQNDNYLTTSVTRLNSLSTNLLTNSRLPSKSAFDYDYGVSNNYKENSDRLVIQNLSKKNNFYFLRNQYIFVTKFRQNFFS